MAESKSASVVFTNSSLLAKDAQASANSAKSAADNAYNLANGAQKTADGKNSIYRGSDPNTVPTTGLKEGDLYFTDDTLYTWNGSSWEETVSDTTGEEINARVDEAIVKAKSAEETADGKNKVYRVKDPSAISTADLKTGDICFTDDSVYTWNGTAWEKTVSDTTGAEIKAYVDQNVQELDSSLESTKNLAIEAQTTADGKNTIYRGSSIEDAPKSGVIAGDLFFSSNELHRFDGTNWEQVVSDTTGSEISAKVDQVAQENQKAVTDLTSNVESKVNDLDASIESTRTDLTAANNAVASDLSTTKSDLANVSKDLSDTKSNMQSGLDAVNNSLSETKNDLANVSKDLSDTKSSTQSSLDAINEDLSTAKSDLVSVSNDLSTTKSDLADTGNRLDTAVSDFQKKTDQLSGSLETANSKIEFNSNAISEVKQTADEISSTVSNMKVGGRNLVLGTQEAKTIFDGTTNANRNDITLESGYYWPDRQRVVLKEHLSNLGLTYNDTLTVTGTLTISKNGTLTKSDFADTFVVALFRSTNNWNRHVFLQKNDLVDGQTTYNVKETFVIGDTGSPGWLGWESPSPYFWLNVAPTGYSIIISQYQVEKGNMATDWTPAPEDTDQAISTVSQTADAIRADLTNTQGDVASVKATASSLQSQITDNKNNISSVKQTADSLTSTVGQMPSQWQQAINDKANAQVLTSGVDMNNLTTAGTYLIKDSSVKNAPISAWFMATVEATADGRRVVQRVKKDDSNVAYERSNIDTGWTAWERIATGTDISSIQQTINDITTRVGNAEGNVSSLQQTAKSIQSSVTDNANNISKVQQTTTELKSDLADAKGNISSLQQTANGLTSRVGSAEGNISQLQQTANGLTSRVGDAEGSISQLQQTADKIQAQVDDNKGNISSVTQTANAVETDLKNTKDDVASIKVKADSLTSTLSNGGVNLLDNSNTFGWGIAAWNGEPPHSIIDDENGLKDCKIVLATGAGNQGFWWPGNNTLNQTYTLSFDVKSDNGIAKLTHVGLENNFLMSNPPTISKDWIRYSVSGKVTLTGNNWVIYFSAPTADNVYVRRVQLEYGDTATPWKPSNGDISSLQQTASKLTSDMKDTKGNISTLQQTASGLTSRVGNAEGNISQLQQTANEISTTVSNIRVGGRNLILGTQTAKTIFDGTTNANKNDATLESGYYWPDRQRIVLKEHLSNLGLTYDDTLTVTGTLTISKNGTLTKSDFADDFTVGLFRTTHNWLIHAKIGKGDLVDGQTTYNVKETFVIGDSEKLGWESPSPYFWLNVAPTGYSISVGQYQVEKGNMATDWTPAPEDTDQAISKVSQTADAIRADLTNTKGDVSSLQQTANSLNAYIKESKGSDTLASLLSMDPTNSTIAQVVNGKPIAAINLSSEGDVTIDGKKLHITASTTIDDASIGSAKIASLSADKITAGTLDASVITVKNINADNITAGTLSAEHLHVTKDTVIDNGVIGNAQISNLSADKITAGTLDASVITVKNINADNITAGTLAAEHLHITKDTVIDNGVIGNAQISNLDAGKITAGTLDASKIDVINLNANSITTGTLNGININGSTFNGGKFVSSSSNITINNTIFDSYRVLLDGNGLEIDSVEKGNGQTALLASRELYLGSTETGNRYIHAMTAEFIGNPTIFINNGNDSTVLSSDGVTSKSVKAGNFQLTGNQIYATDNSSLYVANSAGGNFDGTGSVGFQVWSGIGLGQSTIYTPSDNLYVQQGNVGPALGQSYSSAIKTEIHCKTVTTQVANTVSSRLSVKTDITPVSYDRALAAVEGTEMYDYQYINDDSGQHYVSGIIDDVNTTPNYKMDDMLINKDRTARIDGNLIGYHHVILQKLLERVDALEHQINKA